ncbi:NAD-dependent epimerase/dehydratase family protein [Sabulicella glaciei]|uniref:NAD-dependent epimerase/dehydratase family protein n=1 Tax=Sabulicella glaciei TaxID=2984948 RepID=A0ABT3NSW8_9PROT|nr:NAD-dependent epimerase/dehydratase family protein [Roseococcus sp. MDT2-1-1]MCW8085258.1 NAD-dependent epimerase/dehydratase family protein [Roseococcus sp. MDT2-1-1]
MRVLVTGAAGFIGRHLAGALLESGTLGGVPLREIVLTDLQAPGAPQGSPVPVAACSGDLRDPALLEALFGAQGFDSVFHLAASLTGAAEADLGHGLSVNLLALLGLLERCRGQGRTARLVFASSIAAFGGALPPVVEDDTPRLPQTSYGTQKAVAELLLADHARRGAVDARSLRLPIVVVRPGAPSPSVSDRVAAILREPLLGRDVACPLRPDTPLPLASARRVAQALRTLHDLPGAALGPTRAINLPALTATPAEMAEALPRHAAGRTLGRVAWAPDPALQAVVDGWPRRFQSAAATRLGLPGAETLDDIIRDFLREAG